MIFFAKYVLIILVKIQIKKKNMSTQNEFDLIKEFGLEKLSDEKKVILQDKILGLIDSRFLRVIFKSLPEEQKTELDKLLDGDDSDAVSKFIAENVPEYAEIHKRIVEDLKKEMMTMNKEVFGDL